MIRKPLRGRALAGHGVTAAGTYSLTGTDAAGKKASVQFTLS